MILTSVSLFLLVVIIYRSRRATLLFAKSNVAVRERQITLLWRRCQSSLPFSKNKGAILTYIDVVKTQVKWKVTIRKETLNTKL